MVASRMTHQTHLSIQLRFEHDLLLKQRLHFIVNKRQFIFAFPDIIPNTWTAKIQVTKSESQAPDFKMTADSVSYTYQRTPSGLSSVPFERAEDSCLPSPTTHAFWHTFARVSQSCPSLLQFQSTQNQIRNFPYEEMTRPAAMYER
jgi:hypothetical protein